MSYIIGQLISLIKLLHSENGAGQIAAGLTIGFLMGLSPIASLQSLLFIIILLCFRVQIGAALAMAAITKVSSIGLISPLASVGSWALELSFLQSTYTTLFNMPIIPFSKFNHSVVMGGLVFSLTLGPILFILFYLLVKKYQVAALESVRNSTIGKAIKASTIYQWYLKYLNLTR